jgi:hypothetical protein
MTRREREPEPKSWGEILQLRAAERAQPPAREFYSLPRTRVHTDGGIFADTTPVADAEQHPVCDTHMYSSTALFDPAEPGRPRGIRPPRDHGLSITHWRPPRPPEPPDETKPDRVGRRDRKVRDYDAVTGVPFEDSFKSSVQRILEKREQGRSLSLNRKIDLVSNTFPTAELEATRLPNEAAARRQKLDHFLSKMPANEQRARMGALNVVTGQCDDEDTATRYTDDFPQSQIARSTKAIQQEAKILDGREQERSRNIARVACRHNNGRDRELRDWNIVNGVHVDSCMDESVKYKPSVWAWCETEMLPE